MSKHERHPTNIKETLLNLAKLELGLFQSSLSEDVPNHAETSNNIVRATVEYLSSTTWKRISQIISGENYLMMQLHGSSIDSNDVTSATLFSTPKSKYITLHRNGDFPSTSPYNVELTIEHQNDTFRLTQMFLQTDKETITYSANS